MSEPCPGIQHSVSVNYLSEEAQKGCSWRRDLRTQGQAQHLISLACLAIDLLNSELPLPQMNFIRRSVCKGQTAFTSQLMTIPLHIQHKLS